MPRYNLNTFNTVVKKKKKDRVTLPYDVNIVTHQFQDSYYDIVHMSHHL